ncbi:MAG: hypothetical protein IKA51_05485 [Clostridia bacterium]|nr:hypothetical protein [Clostridia bacterium]
MTGQTGIIGNSRNIELIKALANGKSFGNAFLFLGKKGSGRHLLASHLMASLLCEKSNHCGECRACRLAQKGIHPDIILLTPGENRKNVSVEDVREFVKEAFMKTVEGKKKFLVINDVDKLNVQSQNALLLVLEEPPEQTVFVLFAENKNRVLQTVLSRSTVINTDIIPIKDIEEYLIEKGTEPKKALYAARLSEGSVGKALELCEGERDESQISEALRSFALKSPFLAYEKFFSLSLSSRDDIMGLAKGILGAARDLLVYKATGKIEKTEFFSDEALIIKASSVLSEEGLIKLITVADETVSFAEQNCNVGALSANLFIKGWECFNG